MAARHESTLKSAAFLSDISNRMSDRKKLLTANFARKRAKARRHHWAGTPVTVI
jgi:hypothetical protein